MLFEWDDAKNASNATKHGIDFNEATAVFDDPFHLIADSTRRNIGERRGIAIGRAGGNVIAVIFTDRGERRRIISARRASKNERRHYDRSASSTGRDDGSGDA